MRNVAIITARGGSKRIPRKNIKMFCGKPIIVYSIEAALQSQLFDEVMVSTDDSEIMEIAQSYGATTPYKRSPENSNDFATTAEVLAEVLEQYKSDATYFDNACCIYPTAPFVQKEILQKAYKELSENNVHSVLPIVAYSFPILRSFTKDKNDFIQYHWDEYRNTRSQDLPSFYHDAGQFYFFKVASFLDTKKLIDTNTKGIIVSELQVQDIDNETDWKLAEIKYQLLNNK